MTQDEQASSIGKVVQTYSAAKQQRAAILGEINRIGKVLQDVGREIAHYQHRDPKDEIRTTVPSDYPAPDRLAGLLTALAEVNKLITQSRQLIKDSGLDIQ